MNLYFKPTSFVGLNQMQCSLLNWGKQNEPNACWHQLHPRCQVYNKRNASATHQIAAGLPSLWTTISLSHFNSLINTYACHHKKLSLYISLHLNFGPCCRRFSTNSPCNTFFGSLSAGFLAMCPNHLNHGILCMEVNMDIYHVDKC